MATYKLSLLGLFLIILGALVISILVGNWFSTTEGMLAYQYGTAPVSNVQIPNYTNVSGNYGKHVNLVYDNIYFDTDNANLIELNGNGYTGNADIQGNTLSSISVSSHNDNNNNKNINTFVWNTTDLASLDKLANESKRKFKPSYYEYDYITTSTNTDKYQVFVLPWNDSTYIHVINLTKKTNVVTACFGPDNSSQSKVYETTSNALPFTNNTTIYDSEPYIDSYFENSNIFVLSGQTMFEEKTKLVCMLTDITDFPTIKLYNQQGNYVLPTQVNNQVVSKTQFTPYILYDEIGNKMVLTISNGPKTLIAIFEPNPSYNNYKLFNVKRFGFVDMKAENVYGIDQGPNVGDFHASTFDYNKIEKTSTTTTNTNTNTKDKDTITAKPKDSATPDMLNDYYRWFYYWATQGLNNNPNGPNFNYSDDYIMKTQIVPPVCPSCPSCPSSGTCTNCGGQGGSGTQTASGNTLASGNSSYLDYASKTGQGMISNAQNKATGVITGTEENIGKFATGVKDEVNLAAGSTVNIAKDTVSGAVNLGKDIVGGTVNLGKDIVGGTVGLGREIVGGIANLGQGPAQVQGQGQGVDRTGYSNSYGGPASGLLPQNNSSVVDRSNLYGAMPNKGRSDYMPLNSDFSKFGR